MHKRIWNSLQVEFTIVPKSPLLVKSGLVSPNPSLPDMQFVRTVTANGETVFIPGSSLKGVFRSFTERVLRTLDGWQGACDPFGDNSCGRKLANDEDTAKIYRNSCKACKIYGNTRLRGRIAFTDAFPNGEVKTETRYGVAISRLTNAVAHGPFEMEIVISGSFSGSLAIQNFEVWQLGLIALTIKAINDGLVKIGFGKNRGFGEVEFKVNQAVLDLAKVKSKVPENELWGVGAFMASLDETKQEVNAYGLNPEDKLSGLPIVKFENSGIFERRVYSDNEWAAIADRAIESLPRMLEVKS
ncbi:MAG: RAMP superfamily CRISPR-associated protein [Armatimonadota bacterium]|nr:RAMP superfamily CRISPR-associated protein [Armatimonadota bacterium]